jgi:hypothetical protein
MLDVGDLHRFGTIQWVFFLLGLLGDGSNHGSKFLLGGFNMLEISATLLPLARDHVPTGIAFAKCKK